MAKVGYAETCGFRAGQAAAVRQALAGEDAVLIAADDALVLAEQVADFAAAYA